MPSQISPPTTDDGVLWESILSQLRLATVVIADKLQIFAKLHEHALTAEEAGQAMDLGPRATAALLGNLAAIGLLKQHDGRFHLAAEAREYLLPDSPFYWGPMLQFTGSLDYSPDKILAALKKDKPLGAKVGPKEWDALDMDPADARTFTAAMHSHSFPAATAIARDGDFAGVSRILDVGGGSGCFCIAMADRHPALRFSVFELPAICPLTREYIDKYGFGERIDVAAGDMFSTDWPDDHDAIFFSNVFHDWDLERCRHLANTSFATLPTGGRIYLSEMLLNDTRDGPPITMAFSMDMAFATDGKQFTAPELKELLTEAGFVDVRVRHIFAHYSLISAHKP